MHPADSIRAFAALRDTGMDAEEIAARFGQAVSFVYKMLRLSALAPTLIDLIAKDQLSLEAARALTLTEDHDQQIKVCKAANGHAHTIRRSEEHTSELQSLMRNSYAVFCLKKKKTNKQPQKERAE